MAKKNKTDEIIELVDTLPPMPNNILLLRKAIADPNVNFSMLAPIIKEDSGLCADILRMANSAYYGVHHRVETIDEAIRYIGINHLIDFVSISFSEKAIKKSFPKIKELDDYFVHARQISLASMILLKAAKRSPKEQNVASIAGLLHDIGRLIIMIVGDASLAELLGHTYETFSHVVQDEQELLGIDHCEIGMKICHKWQFPEHLQETILRHHTPVDGNVCEEAAAVFLAHFLCMDDFPDDMLLHIYPPEVQEQLGFSTDIILKAKELFEEEWESHAS